MPIKQSFNAGRIVNPVESLQTGLTGLQSTLLNKEDLLSKDQERKDILAQRAIANQRATERLGLAKAQDLREEGIAKRNEAIYQSGLEKDKALSDIISAVPSTGTVDKIVTTPGSSGNQALINERLAYNKALEEKQAKLDSDRDIASKKYDELIQGYSRTTGAQMRPDEKIITDANRDKVVLREYPRIPGESKRTYYETADGKKIDSLQKLFGGYKEVDSFGEPDAATGSRTISGQSPVAPAVGSTLRSSLDVDNQRAMKESGMDDIVARFNQVTDKKEIPKLVGAIQAENKKVTENRKLTSEEQKQAFIEAVKRNDKLSGSDKMSALGQADKLYSESAKEKEAKRRAAKEFDVDLDNRLRTKYGIEAAEAIAKIQKKYRESDDINGLKYADAKKDKISKAIGLLNYGNQFFRDNDTLEMQQSREYLRTINDELKSKGLKQIDIPKEDLL